MAKLMLVVAGLLVAARMPDEGLDKAAAKAAEMGNYTCTITTKMEGGGGGGGEARAPQPVEMHVKADAPVHLKTGEAEAYRKGDVMAVKSGDTWKRLDPPQRGEGGGGQGERPDGAARAAMMLRGVRAPHEILKDLKSASFKEVKSEDADGGRVYSGTLTEEGVKPFMMGQRRRGGGGGGGDRPAPKSSGTAKVWVNGDGVVTKYEVNIETTFRGRDDEERTMKRLTTVEIKDVGTTKYEVPEDAAKVFAPKSTEK